MWDAHRRSVFLLRDDLEKPLSTDKLVWPSIFNVGMPLSYYDSDFEEDLGDLKWPAPLPINDFFLFSEIRPLQEHVASNWAFKEKPICFIAVTLYIDEGELADASRSGMCAEGSIETLHNSYEFLGYDISESGLLSGLMNCGYGPTLNDVPSLQKTWGPHLNRYHLFTEIDWARQFKQVTNERVREHGPFHVFGLYRWNPR
jgi:hypothetical protein